MFSSHLIASLLTFAPVVIVALTALVVMTAIAIKRSHFWSATLSVIGLNAALISLIAQVLGLLPFGQVHAKS